tara:strand:+ start:106 stop:501 length:396 start_codon:yes stop_codon:yes gene_type:complete
MRQWLEDVETRYGIDKLTLRSRQLVLVSFVLLLLLLLVIYWRLGLQGDGLNWRPIAIFALPLVLFLPSIIGKRARGHAWLAFVSLLYFTKGVMLITLPGLGILGGLVAIMALALFTGCMGYARFRSRQLRH